MFKVFCVCVCVCVGVVVFNSVGAYVTISVRPAGRVSVCGKNLNVGGFLGHCKYEKCQTLHGGSAR